MMDTEIGHYIWDTRYRWMRDGDVMDRSIRDTWRRVANAAARREAEPEVWRERFAAILEDFRFIPGGRILAGAGTDLNVTLFNCFVMGTIRDDLSGIFESLREGALTMQAGGGVGYDFSTLRPQGAVARSTANIASGPVSYMRVWNAMCETLLSTGARRGAMMATLRCDHPDVEQFIDAKRDSTALSHFNLSLQVTDEFMRVVDAGEEWPLVFPVAGIGHGRYREIVMRDWPGYDAPVACAVVARRPARDLWRRLMQANYEAAEPGVLFVDTINAMNNLAYCEHISCTNPCGEIPLPSYGACNLGSINLTRFVSEPFSPQAAFDFRAVGEVARIATRFLDDIIDCSGFPLPQQAESARGSRRIGIGITGLADALIMAGLHYGSAQARETAAALMRTICHEAYRASIELAPEKGTFPLFDKRAYPAGRFIVTLPDDIRESIEQVGIRNSHLLAIAPAGTISLLAGNVSSGIEPVFDFSVTRRVRDRRSEPRSFTLEDYAWRLWRDGGGDVAHLPPAFVRGEALAPGQQLAMQGALQPFVDSAISKTVSVPEAYRFEDFDGLYRLAWQQGLKGCTTYRTNSRSAAVIAPARCCVAA